MPTEAGVSIDPSERDSLIDERPKFVVRGLTPLQAVVLTATSTDAAGLTWTSSLVYWASSQGEVDTEAQAIRGPRRYAGRKFWGAPLAAMEPYGTTPAHGATYSWKGAESRPFHLTVTDVGTGKPLATDTIYRSVMHPRGKMEQRTVAQDGFYGRYFHPGTRAKKPAALIFGGSEGGLHPIVERFASLLAAHGYPALALAYFAGPSLTEAVNSTLPQSLSNIPLEYFASALDWLGGRSGVEASFVVGTSRGSEAALLVGALYQHLARGVIANVPNNVVGPALTPSRQWNPWSPAWTYKGAPLTPGMRIPVGKIKGRLFLDAAGVDREWNAIGTHLLDQIQELRPQPNRDFIRRDRKAGHGVGALVPYLPFVDPRSEAKRLRGVNVFANKIDDAWLWPQLLTFLRG